MSVVYAFLIGMQFGIMIMALAATWVVGQAEKKENQ